MDHHAEDIIRMEKKIDQVKRRKETKKNKKKKRVATGCCHIETDAR